MMTYHFSGRLRGNVFEPGNIGAMKDTINQVYWTPIQAAKRFKTSTSHLKVIEKELCLLIDQKECGKNMERRYTVEDLYVIGQVIHAKNLGIPLSTIKMYGLDRLPEIVEFFTKLSQSK